MIDGSFVEAPLLRNTRDENKQVKKGKSGEKHYDSKVVKRVMQKFWCMEECLYGMSSRVVGFARNAAYNILANLVYNLCRLCEIGTN